MIDPAPFRLSPFHRRALGVGVVAAVLGALASLGVGFYALAHERWEIGNALLALSVLIGLAGHGLYVRRALGMLHQRQLWTMAALTDPHTPELAAELAPDGEPTTAPDIPAPRPAVVPEPSKSSREGAPD